MQEGDLYIAERDNHVIRKVDVKTGPISTVAGTGIAGYSGPALDLASGSTHETLESRESSSPFRCD